MYTTKILSVFILTLALGKAVTAQLPASSTDISPLLLGEKVPDATLISSTGDEVSLLSILKQKPTVIVIYNGLWCYFCGVHFTEQIVPVAEQVSELGYNMITISPDMPDSLVSMSRKVGLPAGMFYQDGDGSFSSAMGIAYQATEGFLERLTTYSGGLNQGYLPVPSVFVVNPDDQSILYEYINPNGMASDIRIRGTFLIAVLQALQP